ncbi:MFS transporter [Streptomyces sp. NPDC057137]|uniref:MFS transporter n=1 Tax=Streptomyces sp. NPDC057137 TaxID=3346030 RepID=UPI00362A5A16
MSPPTSGRRTAALVATLCLGGTVTALQQTLLIPILPELPRLLGTSAANVSWLITATLLAAAVATPVASRLADMYGKRTVMLCCLVLMVAGSLIGALTHGLAGAVTARALQGVGVALIPIGIAIMRDELPAAKAPLGVALMSATVAVGGGVALPLSGLVAQNADWHVLFWVTGGAGTLMLAAVAVVVPSSSIRTGGTFDFWGAALLSIAVTSLLLALTKGGQWGWTAPGTLLCTLGGAVVLAAWVPLELRVRRPLVDLRIARRPALLLVNVATAFVGFGMFADPLVTTQLLQAPTGTGYGHGLEAVTTGLLLAPTAVVFGAAAPLSAFLTRRYGAAVTLGAGALCMGAAYVARIWFSHGVGPVLAGSLVVSLGASLAFGAMPVLVLMLVPATESASANGFNALMRSIGTSTASAVAAGMAGVGAREVGGTVFPGFDALMGVFVAAAGACLLATLAMGPLLCRRRPADESATGSLDQPRPDKGGVRCSSR